MSYLFYNCGGYGNSFSPPTDPVHPHTPTSLINTAQQTWLQYWPVLIAVGVHSCNYICTFAGLPSGFLVQSSLPAWVNNMFLTNKM
jgi:hypothetical protein